MWVLWHLAVKGAGTQVPIAERSALDPFCFAKGSTSWEFSLQLPQIQVEIEDRLSAYYKMETTGITNKLPACSGLKKMFLFQRYLTKVLSQASISQY